MIDRISFEDFRCVMTYEITENQACIEIEFSVDNCEEYQTAWLGKMLDNETKKVVYWFGLTEDGTQAYDFGSFEEFISARVFYDKSIKEVWDSISLRSIDACNIQDRLPFYLG